MDADAVQPDWRALIEAAMKADKDKRGKAGVAERLGFKRAYVSRALATGNSSAGFPNGVPQNFINRVIERFHQYECPATLQIADRQHCRAAILPAPTHNPLAMRIWRECQSCPHKPVSEVSHASSQ